MLNGSMSLIFTLIRRMRCLYGSGGRQVASNGLMTRGQEKIT